MIPALNIRRTIVLLTGISGVLFFTLLALAILHSPDRSAGTFQLGRIYLSTLGRTVSLSGQPNTQTRLYFSMAVLLMSCSFIPFWWLTARISGHRTRRLIFVLGCGLSLGLIAGVFLPQDTFPAAHKFVTRTAGACGLLAVGLATAHTRPGSIMYRLRPWWLGLCAALILTSLAAYAAVQWLHLPDCPTFAILQAVAVLTMTFWLYLELAEFWRVA